MFEWQTWRNGGSSSLTWQKEREEEVVPAREATFSL